MTETMSTITDAQRSRGMEMEGKILTRIKAFFPLISPVIMSSLISTRERAIALEVRGFDSKQKKTFLSDIKTTHADIAFKAILSFILILSIIWRGIIWLS